MISESHRPRPNINSNTHGQDVPNFTIKDFDTDRM